MAKVRLLAAIRRATRAPPDGPRNGELVARIVDAPEDDAPRRVYADWLEEQGSPLGPLIQRHMVVRRRG